MASSVVQNPSSIAFAVVEFPFVVDRSNPVVQRSIAHILRQRVKASVHNDIIGIKEGSKAKWLSIQNISLPKQLSTFNTQRRKIRKKLLSRQTRRGASQTLFIFKKRALVHLCSVLNCIFQSLNCNCQCSFLYSSTSKITHIQCQSIIIICSHTKGK